MGGLSHCGQSKHHQGQQRTYEDKKAQLFAYRNAHLELDLPTSALQSHSHDFGRRALLEEVRATSNAVSSLPRPSVASRDRERRSW
jgi:hypothetical protein